MKALLILLLLACTATARVGETFAEFRKRVGVEPDQVDTSVKGVLKARFTLEEFFVIIWVVDDTISFEQFGGGIYKELAEALLAKYPDKWEASPLRFQEIQSWKNSKGLTAELNGGRLIISDGRLEALATVDRRKHADKQAEKF